MNKADERDRRRRSEFSWPTGWPAASLVGVAAVALIIVLVISDWARPDQRVETGPAEDTDVPIDQPDSEPGSWGEYRERTDPATVQLCLTRVLGNRLLADDVYAPTDNADLMSTGPTAGRLGYLRTGEQVLALISGRLAMTPVEAASLADQAQAFDAVEAARIDEAGEPDDAAVAERFVDYLDVHSNNPLMTPDPGSCWLETEVGDTQLTEFAQATSDEDRIACLVNAQFVHAVETQLDNPDLDRREVIVATSFELRWNDGDIAAGGEIYSELQEAQLLSVDGFNRVAGTAVDRVVDPAFDITNPGCPLNPVR